MVNADVLCQFVSFHFFAVTNQVLICSFFVGLLSQQKIINVRSSEVSMLIFPRNLALHWQYSSGTKIEFPVIEHLLRFIDRSD